ncbi:MAG: carboxymuconolactone decarboxylase family protein [Flavobacteriales bacterium]|nr:carboxymuconolactone decarboxylase family protein [Flavobacteriales bacterium]
MKTIKKPAIKIHLLELISLRIAQLCNCSYGIKIHSKELNLLGDTDLRMSLLYAWKATPYFSKKEIVVLQLVDYLIKKDTTNKWDVEFREGLLEHFNKKEIYYLIVAIREIDLWSRLMAIYKSNSIT